MERWWKGDVTDDDDDGGDEERKSRRSRMVGKGEGGRLSEAIRVQPSGDLWGRGKRAGLELWAVDRPSVGVALSDQSDDITRDGRTRFGPKILRRVFHLISSHHNSLFCHQCGRSDERKQRREGAPPSPRLNC